MLRSRILGTAFFTGPGCRSSSLSSGRSLLTKSRVVYHMSNRLCCPSLKSSRFPPLRFLYLVFAVPLNSVASSQVLLFEDSCSHMVFATSHICIVLRHMINCLYHMDNHSFSWSCTHNCIYSKSYLTLLRLQA